MKDFENLQNIWKEQKSAEKRIKSTDIAQKAKAKTKAIKKKHIWTICILVLTSLFLVGYFIWVGFYHVGLFTVGLGGMVGMLLLRIILEAISIHKFKNIAFGRPYKEYTQLIIRFYHWRKKIHYVLTPVIYICYSVGFAMILPILKANISQGFFIYIIISGIIVFFGMGWFIYKQIKKEIDLVKYLKSLELE